MTEFAALRRKKYGYLIDVNDENNRSKDTKKVCHIRQFDSYKHCLEAAQLENEIN